MRRLLLPTTLMAALAATMLLPVQPASAYTDAEHISIAVGEHKIIDKAAILGVSASFQASAQLNAYPPDCDTDPVGCEVVPIDLNVPEEDPDAIEQQAYLLSVTLRFDSGQQVDNLPELGTVRQNDLEGYLYQDPYIRNSSGTETYTAWTHGNNPGVMTAVSPTSKKFNLVVALYSGTNDGYQLEISLIRADDVKFEPGKYARPGKTEETYEQPTFTPEAGSPQQNGFGGANLPPMGGVSGVPTPAVQGGPIVVPNIPNGRPDGGLVALSKVARPTGLGKHSVEVDSTVAETQKVDKGTTKVLLTLLALPVLAVIAGVVLVARRRKAAQPVL